MNRTIFLFVCFIFFYLYSPANTIYGYSYIKDLSNSSINVIYQDSLEYVWIGTWDGLNRYNGHTIKSYYPQIDQQYSISNNIIRSIHEERKGVLWIVTDWGVNRLDIQTDKIERHYLGFEQLYPFKENIYSLSIDGDGAIVASSTYWGLSYYNQEMRKFISINTNLFNTQNISKIKFDGKRNLWILHTDGLLECCSYIIDNGEFIVTEVHKEFSSDIQYMEIDGTYLTITDLNNMLYLYHLTDLKEIFKKPIKSKVISSNIQGDIMNISYGIGGYENISIYNHLKPYNNYGLDEMKHRNVLCSWIGPQNTMWYGTDGNGVIMFHDINKSFNKIQIPSSYSPIRAISKTGDKLILGTKGDGVFIIDFLSQQREIRNISVKQGLSDNRVYCIEKNREEDLFIGTDGEDVTIYQKGAIYKLLNKDGISPLNEKQGIYSLCFTNNDSILWVGTAYAGLFKLNIALEGNKYIVLSYKQYDIPQDRDSKLSVRNAIFKIISESDKYLWVANRGSGVLRFDVEKEMFHSISGDSNFSMSNTDVISLYRDRKGNIWAGTSLGLNKIKIREDGSAQTTVYTHSTAKLPNNTIHGIIEDDSNNIWISTNKGLTKLNPVTNEVMSYSENDGLHGNEFSDGAYFISNDTLYFGGINGLSWFNPSEIKMQDHMPQLHIESFTIYNTPTLISEKLKTGKKNGSDYLSLKYNENSFSFTIVATEYINNDNCEYAYFLDGYNKEWVEIANSNNIVFSNVPAGKYRLWIKHTNGNKQWSEKKSYLIIKISPPWWESIYAMIIYLLIFLQMCYILWKTVRNRREKNKINFIKELQKKETQRVYEAKLRFFTNIAHEFCTPLSLIYGPSIKIMESERADSYIKKYARIIRINSDRMNKLISELLEFRRVETGHSTVNWQYVDVQETIQCIVDNFEDIIEEKKIDFNLIFKDERLNKWPCDRGYCEKIIFNLMSNALKYTPDMGYISVECYVDFKNNLRFNIKNSGHGIKAEKLDGIFNRFMVLDDFENNAKHGFVSRNGIGLSLCKTLINELDGDISVESDGAQYVCFQVILPYRKLDKEIAMQYETELQIKHALESVDENNYTQDKYTNISVLIVEDDPDMRMFLKDILNNDGFIITEASNGSDAFNVLCMAHVDIIITDIFMPVMNGFEFAEKVKNSNVLKHIPMIFLSGMNDDKYKINASKIGSEIFIDKPFHPQQVINTIKAILKQQKFVTEYAASGMSSLTMEDGKSIHIEDKEFLNRVKSIIDIRIEDEELTTEIISMDLNISKMTFYRRIKELTGKTPSEYIKDIKILKACELLKKTKLSVTEIMYKSGFNHKSYFYKEFHKRHELTPKEYRDKINN